VLPVCAWFRTISLPTFDWWRIQHGMEVGCVWPWGYVSTRDGRDRESDKKGVESVDLN
jgi:hypothetical protein